MTALFRPRKGLEILLDALAILRHQGIPVRLHAVGPFENPEYENEIRRRIDALEIGHLIHWTGFTTDVAAELTKMDVFVLPSLFGEGLPMVVLEAMAAGVPVVATRVEGVPEAIEHGVSGLIANPNDPESLAACIKSVVQGDADWKALRQCALLRHSTEFSDSLMASRLSAIYRQILD
jgi:glycosyltransferase involved in cell wall biosynthesis